jgi:hypothetical protein
MQLHNVLATSLQKAIDASEEFQFCVCVCVLSLRAHVAMLVAVSSLLAIRAPLQVVNQQFNGRSSTGILSCALPRAVVVAR